MSTTVVIWLGILAWSLLAIPVALLAALMIRLRDQEGPDRAGPGAPMDGESGNGAESLHAQSGRRLGNKT